MMPKVGDLLIPRFPRLNGYGIAVNAEFPGATEKDEGGPTSGRLLLTEPDPCI